MNGFTRLVARIFLGPNDEKISNKSVALGGPSYPIPPLTTSPPTSLTYPSDWAAARAAIAAARIEEPTPDPAVTITHPAEDAMSDNPRTATPADSDEDIDVALANRNDLTDSGVHAIPEENAAARYTISAACPECRGAGYVQRGVNDLLRDTVAMLPIDGGDEVIKEFYRRLLHAAPSLTPLFPRDLLTAAVDDTQSPGALQRDRLLQALIAVSELYGGSPEDMERLDTAIVSFGNAHAAFARPDGSVQGATEEEYDAVISVFLRLLGDALGDKFTTAHWKAWYEAMHYVKIGMLWAQYHSGMRMARYPRRDAGHRE